MRFLRVISNLLRFDRTNWTALTLCLFAAAVFWIFNALNKDYSTNLSFPLLVEFDQSKYAVAEHIPAKLTVNVHGNGWELLRKSLGQKVPIVSIPLERPTEIRRIPGAALAPQVMSQLGSLQLNYVVLDTLRLFVEPRTSRKLKLAADVTQVAFRNNQGRISPVVVLPDSIQLEGPASYIHALADSILIVVPPRRITASYRENLEVRMDKSEFIQRNPPVVEVMFEVGPVITMTRQLPLILPRNLLTSADSLSITLRIPGRDEARFDIDFSAITVSLPEIKLAKGDTVRVLPRLFGLPDYASVLRMDSVELRSRQPE